MKIAIIIIACLLLLFGCSQPEEPIRPVEVRTVETRRPAPIVPSVDQLRLRPVSWIILTPENIEEKFAELQGSELVFFGLTANGYENLALNISDIRANIEQQQQIIAIYQNQF